jgi:hypothetical protein
VRGENFAARQTWKSQDASAYSLNGLAFLFGVWVDHQWKLLLFGRSGDAEVALKLRVDESRSPRGCRGFEAGLEQLVGPFGDAEA